MPNQTSQTPAFPHQGIQGASSLCTMAGNGLQDVSPCLHPGYSYSSGCPENIAAVGWQHPVTVSLEGMEVPWHIKT